MCCSDKTMCIVLLDGGGGVQLVGRQRTQEGESM